MKSNVEHLNINMMSRLSRLHRQVKMTLEVDKIQLSKIQNHRRPGTQGQFNFKGFNLAEFQMKFPIEWYVYHIRCYTVGV